MPLLLDTHAVAWVLLDHPALSAAARAAIAAADAALVSPISLYEIGQKVRLGRWPAMTSAAPELPDLLARAGLLVAPLTPRVALHASLMDWDHRDPFDRLLAATAEIISAPFVSCDVAFDARPLRRVW